jgi:hypothetical protein
VQTFRPIRIFAIVLVCAGIVAAFWGARILLFDPEAPLRPIGYGTLQQPLFYFWLVSTVFYTGTGIGVLYQTKWGYVLFTAFLCILFVGFPIGTIIAYMTFSYMKRNELKRHFGFA